MASNAFTESTAEPAALAWLESLGWAGKRGPNWKTRVKGVEQFSKKGE